MPRRRIMTSVCALQGIMSSASSTSRSILYRLHASNSSKQMLAMWEENLYVVRKTLREDPSLYRTLGRAAINQRLFDLLFEVGYCHHDAGRPAEARHQFLQARVIAPLTAGSGY